MTLRLLHTPGWDPSGVAPALAASGIVAAAVQPDDPLPAEEAVTVLVVDPAARAAMRLDHLASQVDAGLAILILGAPGEADAPPDLAPDLVSAFLPESAGPRQLLIALRAAFREAHARRQAAAARLESADRTFEISELTEIGLRLLTERNHALLLELILTQARRVTQSDAGSLYLVERGDPPCLRFMLAQNESRPDIPFAERTLPLDRGSLAGYAAATGEPLAIDDVYELAATGPYAFNRTFDERYGYRTRSMLVVPMPNHRGEVIGVLQLINRKRDPLRPFADVADVERRALPYTAHTIKIAHALAGQAAVSIENAQLYAEIEQLFEGFVRAAVTAIEQRDPTTSGHSERVAVMSVRLAEVVDAEPNGRYGPVRFTPDQLRELRYAALLHDVGKVGVREQVLTKPKKLHEGELERIRHRHAFIRRTADWEYERARADYLLRHGHAGYAEFECEIAERHRRSIADLDRLLEAVRECNEPTVLAEGDFQRLHELADCTYVGLDGTPQPFLTAEEVRLLSIRRGSLDEAEWEEMRSHVVHTYTFLQAIPWTAALSRVPEIARAHHEKLNGVGYPRQIRGDEIPLQSRVMTIVDIYDALTAADRPYKRAVHRDHALDILAEEVREGMLDADLYRMFVEARVFEASPVTSRDSPPTLPLPLPGASAAPAR